MARAFFASVNARPGTGAFKGAAGTIKVKTISNTKHAVTITYSG